MLRPAMSAALLLAALVGLVGGCATVSAPVGNPVYVPAGNPELAWERTVDALHDFKLPIARENKLDGVIETDYVIGSSILEPWRRDSVGLDNRLESTFQSIRRRAFITLTPSPQGGYLVAVEAYKELEDVNGPVANSAGGATFQVNQPLQRDLNLVVGQSTPSGWINLGRDYALEQALLKRIRSRF